ncbi:MAG: hypothetical protein DHS20C16_35940 [Phycisphaerae bacterium]|nr:MAG: hypothetical protein DHS20C16_35940 [Phycisphaerae bacterium]
MWFAAIVLIAGCDLTPADPTPQPTECAPSDKLLEVFGTLENVDHPCREWIDETHGRVARSGNASAAVWSRSTQAGSALLVSAVHTLGVGWFGPANTEIEAELRDPSQEIGVVRITFVAPDGGALDSDSSPMFDFFNQPTPADQNNNFFADILPRYDAFVAVVDDQKLMSGLLPPQPGPLQFAPPDIYDPLERTTTAPTFSDVNPDDMVMAVGFPAEGSFAGEMTASIGTVLSASEVDIVLQMLADAGDEEGFIEYDPDVEFIFRGPAAGGMSGGGVFNESAELVGVLVRASDPLDGVQYVRAVRMSFLVGELNAEFEALPDGQKEVIGLYLDSAE